MYTVKYELYRCDYDRQSCVKTFSSLTAIEDWLFDQMQQPYERMWFPSKEPERIEATPVLYGPSIWIYQITSPRGIEFTTGRFTNGQKHWSEEVKVWLKHCNERKNKPKFVFA